MAYKPFKPNKGNYYTDAGNEKDFKNEIRRMKLFGLRTGVAWKMIPALFYYTCMILFLVSCIMGEIREFQFESLDIVLCILKYIFITVLLFSPAIFLSDFKFRDKLPLFKRRTLMGNTLGMLIVIIFSVFMIWTYQYCMSDTYKDSADKYYQEMENKNMERMKEYEESTQNQR